MNLQRYLDYKIYTFLPLYTIYEFVTAIGNCIVLQRKYNKITALSRILQEDPSCQLLTVLRRYIARVSVQLVEENLAAETTPHIITIQKGETTELDS